MQVLCQEKKGRNNTLSQILPYAVGYDKDNYAFWGETDKIETGGKGKIIQALLLENTVRMGKKNLLS